MTPPASPTSGEIADFKITVKSIKGFVDSQEVKGQISAGQPDVNYVSAN